VTRRSAVGVVWRGTGPGSTSMIRTAGGAPSWSSRRPRDQWLVHRGGRV